MAQPYKQKKVQTITERLKDAKSIVVIDYKGIDIEEVSQLRNRMREADVDYFVSKNTFIKIALNDLGVTELDDKLVGPTAIAISKVDEVSPARELAKFKKEVMYFWKKTFKILKKLKKLEKIITIELKI